MAVIGVDLGGTKFSSALSSEVDQFSCYNKVYLNGAKGDEVGELIKVRIQSLLADRGVKLYIHPSHNMPGDTTAHERLEDCLRVYKDRVAGV